MSSDNAKIVVPEDNSRKKLHCFTLDFVVHMNVYLKCCYG